MLPIGDFSVRSIRVWQEEAACRGIDRPDLFFPEQGVNPTFARTYCPQCPVQSECLEYGIIYDEPGIWGGKTRKERKALTYVRPSLIAIAKKEGLYESRPSIDRLLAAQHQEQLRVERELALDASRQLEPEPTPEQLAAVSVPTVREQVSLAAMLNQ
jgi:hypothetical protein